MVHGMRGRPPAVRAGQRMQAGTLLRQALTQALTQRAAAAWQRAYARAVSGPSQPVQGGGSEGGGPVRQARGIAPPHPPTHTRARACCVPQPTNAMQPTLHACALDTSQVLRA